MTRRNHTLRLNDTEARQLADALDRDNAKLDHEINDLIRQEKSAEFLKVYFEVLGDREQLAKRVRKLVPEVKPTKGRRR